MRRWPGRCDHGRGLRRRLRLRRGNLLPAARRVHRRSRDSLHLRRERLRRVQDSGAVLATTRTGGQVGGMHASAGLLRVDVHPGGLVVKPILMPAIAVPAQDIVALQTVRVRLGGAQLQVETRPGLPHLRLLLAPEGPVGRALEQSQKPVAANGAGQSEQLPIVGRSPAMQEIYRIIARLTQTDLTVMIVGESPMETPRVPGSKTCVWTSLRCVTTSRNWPWNPNSIPPASSRQRH